MSYKELAEKAIKAGKFNNLTPKYIEFEKAGDLIVGRYISKSEVISQNSDKPYCQYLFDSDLGLIKFHLGSAADGEAGGMFKEGKIYHIVYEGKQELKGGKSVNKYKISEILTDEN